MPEDVMTDRRTFLRQAAAASALIAAAAGRAEVIAPADTTAARMKSYTIPHTSIRVSRLAYGTALLGNAWVRADFLSKTITGIRSAYDNGITLFDLADVYGGGASEEAL